MEPARGLVKRAIALSLAQLMVPLVPSVDSAATVKSKISSPRYDGATTDRARFRWITKSGGIEDGPYPRILDTGCDYAAGRSVAV